MGEAHISDFSLLSTELEWSSRVGPRLKVGALVEGITWTPKPGVLARDSSGKFGRSWVLSFRVFKKLRLRSERYGTFLLKFIFHLGVFLVMVEP